MLRYEKLPASTPRGLIAKIILVGGCLGFSIMISSFISLYGLTGFLVNYFYPASQLTLSVHEAGYLGIIGLLAAATTAMMGFLAFFMNRLSKNAVKLSWPVLLPLLVIALAAWWLHSGSTFHTHPPDWLTVASYFSVPLGGIVPALFLHTPAARKLHNR